ncbi:monooxygenase flavin-binding family protein [Paractinoplanes deccanensis]|uniref:Monooxygenase flavin-binding family protein n=1 Tax=Paractinoplanes deccanensis TaxID=113561 RepID=A0ABQ3YF15_9ACTN|nr:NAD(P)/FAD-dependent oxidoreductase [Actinoplanes deccanensis]GID78568.1 monooxygenase flavin-binding family protein [Actinoplanes deccanensis]
MTHFDVIIIGAGLSGVGAAWRLQESGLGKTYAILEARDAIGGTWDLFRYPGVRSDSDMFTLSYPFRPWNDAQSLASGDRIRDYIQAIADEGGITRHIRFGAKVVAADWSSGDARWTLTLADGSSLTCSFVYACAGYYNYDSGYQPDFPGLDEFEGQLVHPQFWPEGLDYRGKRVVVIGSGATAVTLVPAMARDAAHVTMLQRSPTYLTSLPSQDVVARTLLSVLPPKAAGRVARAKNILVTQGFYQLARRQPQRVRKLLRAMAVRGLDGDQAYVDEHFKPAYDPWDQRLCVIPEGDLYAEIRAGRASVVTDHIDAFVPSGIRLKSGDVLEADIVVSATGLSLLPIGGVRVSVDGTAVELGKRGAYRGLMLSGVPNLAYCIGYVNASWTLRADLSHRYVMKLLRHMDRHGLAVATPAAPGGSGRPLLDLSSGYVQRALDDFPRQGDRAPWIVRQNYLRDVLTTPRADVTRDMHFRRAVPSHRALTPARSGAAPTAGPASTSPAPVSLAPATSNPQAPPSLAPAPAAPKEDPAP